jgi:hyaluronate lyase
MQGNEILTLDGIAVQNTNKTNPVWAHLEGTGGYFFPNGGKLQVRRNTNVNAFFEMWFEHGISPSDESYSYVILPNKTVQETAAYSANPDIEVLSNTNNVQTVREKGLGATGMVFWEKGSFGDITVTRPLIVMTRDSGNEYVVSFSDPTQKLTTVRIMINGIYNINRLDKGLKVSIENNMTVIYADVESSNGKTFTARFTK